MEENFTNLQFIHFNDNICQIFNWDFCYKNKLHTIQLKEIFENKDNLYLSKDGINWGNIAIPNKNKINSISYSFIDNDLMFNIVSLNECEYELYINNKNFKDLEKIEKNANNINFNNNKNGEYIFINDIKKYEQNNININKDEEKSANNLNEIKENINKIKENINEIKDNINEIKENINEIKENINEIKDNKISDLTLTERKPKTRNNKSNIPYQSSDELLKIAIKKEKAHIKEIPDNRNNINHFYIDDNIPLFARDLPVSIYHVYQSKNKSMDKMCSICLENFIIGKRIITLPCFHFFHVKCIASWLNKNSFCPICKFNIKNK